jgi:hypothetical protein
MLRDGTRLLWHQEEAAVLSPRPGGVRRRVLRCRGNVLQEQEVLPAAERLLWHQGEPTLLPAE